MTAPTLSQRLLRRRDDRRAIAFGLLFAAGAALLVLLVLGLANRFDPLPAAAAAPLSDVPTTEPRVCAAVAVYTRATADDWAQRALIAHASLNARPTDCRSPLGAVVGSGIDPIRWQQALDAVEAVASGSYPVPLACARVNAIVSTAARPGSPLFHAGARAQCVIRDLAFVEVQS